MSRPDNTDWAVYALIALLIISCIALAVLL